MSPHHNNDFVACDSEFRNSIEDNDAELDKALSRTLDAIEKHPRKAHTTNEQAGQMRLFLRALVARLAESTGYVVTALFGARCTFRPASLSLP